MSFVDSPAVIARANADGEFQLHARFWNARLALVCGAQAQRLTISHGRMIATEATAQDAEADVTISAAPADWNALLEPVPRPFYHDLQAAMAHHGFELIGETRHCAAYYPAIRRLIDILREVRNDRA